jgi:uncharacterized protein (TIGR02001 family)
LLLWTLAAGSAASEDSPHIVTGSIGATSDFVFRGFSLTRGEPTVQASLDWEFPREIYVGGFVAGADPNAGPSPSVEFDVWAGKYWRLDDAFSFDLRLSRYTYPDDPRRADYDRTELTGTLGYRDRWFLAAIYSPDTEALASSPGYGGEVAWALEVSRRHAFDERFSLSAGAGIYGLEEVYRDNLLYWNATLTASLPPFELQLAWLGIDAAAEEHFSGDSIGNRIALTALWRFSSAR